jgi:imidazolonepropionase-like amidohydrolase
MSGMPLHLELAKLVEQGKMLGPDIVTTGPILNSPGPNAQDNHQLVRTDSEARAAVRAQYDAGYRFLKVYSNLNREAYEAILDEAHRLGMPISGHTPEGIRYPGVPVERPFDIEFDEVLAQDWWTVEHVESIAWHGLRDRIDDEQMRALALRIAEAGIVVTPTLIAHDNLVRVAETRGAYLDRPETDTINPLLKRLERDTYEFWSAQDPSAREGPRADFYLRATGMLHDAGVRLIAGSDAGIFTNIPGSALTRELELLVRAGLTPHEALATATATAGPAIGLPDRGQIASGFKANLVLLPGDPLTDIGTVERPTAVMTGGRWLDSRSLKQLRDAARQTSELRTARHLLASLLEIW